MLIEPLPYAEPDRLALVERIVRAGGLEHRDTSVDGRTWEMIRGHSASADAAVFSRWTTGVNLVVCALARSGRGRPGKSPDSATS